MALLSPQHHTIDVVENGLGVGNNLKLYKDALEGNWESARRMIEQEPGLLSAAITHDSGTILHVSAGTGHSIKFLEELVNAMPEEMLALKDNNGDTALFNAASAGYTRAAATMVGKNGNLPQIRNNCGQTPIVVAAAYGNRDMVWYLCSVTKDVDPSPFRDQDGVSLLNLVIIADFYDVALHLLQRFPQLARVLEDSGDNALHKLARKPLAFMSGSHMGFWQRLIYSRIRIEVADAVASPNRGNVNNPTQSSIGHDHLSNGFPSQFLQAAHVTPVLQFLNGLLRNAKDQFVLALGIQQVRDMKLMHIQSIELVKFICAQVVSQGNRYEIVKLLGFPLLTAAKYGIVEIITECVRSYPDLIWSRQMNMQNIFHIAVANRQEKVFNLLSEMSAHKKSLVSFLDNSGNNILHFTGWLAPYHKLNSISGPALQMQHELKWYKEVEQIVKPAYKELMNSEGKTAKVLFTEEHKELAEKGERWMKDTSTSCTIVAILNTTMMFAATITVPGGNDGDSGNPIFLQENSFMTFAVSDMLSLFSSASSVLMFLSILTSRYAEEDFHMHLPKRMIIGLATLFLSISCMMISFSATLSIVLRHRLAWVIIPVALLACLPITLFALLQLPLFIELVSSTYGFKILKRHRGPRIY